jgi:hypothetical protein
VNVKSGIYTSEFWVTAIVNIAMAVLGVLAARGLVSGDEAELWVNLIQAITVAVVPVVMAIVTTSYTNGRARVKEAAIRNGGLA